jgi:hypothetical protein
LAVNAGLVLSQSSSEYQFGPGWWLLVIGGLVLAAGGVVGTRPLFFPRPRLVWDRQSLPSAVVVLLAGLAWTFFRGVDLANPVWWAYLPALSIPLLAVCLPVTILSLDGQQRLWACAAVSAACLYGITWGAHVMTGPGGSFGGPAGKGFICATIMLAASCFALSRRR